jgi:Zn-dependent protease with chaperone function
VLAGAYLKTKYGSTNFGMNLGITNTHIIIASYIGNAVAGWLRTSMGDYRPAMLMMLLFSGVALLIVMATSRSNSKAAFIDP